MLDEHRDAALAIADALMRSESLDAREVASLIAGEGGDPPARGADEPEQAHETDAAAEPEGPEDDQDRPAVAV